MHLGAEGGSAALSLKASATSSGDSPVKLRWLAGEFAISVGGGPPGAGFALVFAERGLDA
jgi:hypothetical protein